MTTYAEEAARLLRERADSYANDASALRHMNQTDEAIVYETITDELRQVASSVLDAPRAILTKDERKSLLWVRMLADSSFVSDYAKCHITTVCDALERA